MVKEDVFPVIHLERILKDSIGRYAMFKTKLPPKLEADLVATLSHLQSHNLTRHGARELLAPAIDKERRPTTASGRPCRKGKEELGREKRAIFPLLGK